MDHLPFSHNTPEKPSLDLPLVCKLDGSSPYFFGHDSFLAFPEKHLQGIQASNRDITNDEALLSLLQSWLYFGVLTEFFQRDIKIDDFTKPGRYRIKLICTNKLPDFQTEWCASLGGFRRSRARKTARQEVGILFARAVFACEQLERAGPRRRIFDLVLFSLKVLLCSLCISARTILGTSETLDSLLHRLKFRRPPSRGSWETNFVLLEYMVKNGWCTFRKPTPGHPPD